MNHSHEEMLGRIQDLIQKGEHAKAQRDVENLRDERFYHVKPGPFEEWRTSALSLIQDVTKPDSYYVKNFKEGVRSVSEEDVDRGIGILGALKTAVEKGYLTTHRTLVAAGIFRDSLERAEYLLENGFENAAASLVGAVLEQGLREMCARWEIPVKKDDGISSLNDKLARKKAYGIYPHEQVEAWKAIRNKAGHGHFKEYTKQHVEDMLKGVRGFLDENLK